MIIVGPGPGVCISLETSSAASSISSSSSFPGAHLETSLLLLEEEEEIPPGGIEIQIGFDSVCQVIYPHRQKV